MGLHQGFEATLPLSKTLPGLSGRVTGTALGSAPAFALGGGAAPGASLGTQSLLGGALSGFTAPVTQGGSRTVNTAAGTLGAGAGHAAAKTAGGLLAPKVRPEVERFKQLFPENRLTPGQILGGTAKTMEDSAEHAMPFVSQGIAQARTRSLEDFNRSILNRVLKPIGRTVTQIGHEGISEARWAVSGAYKAALKGAVLRQDNAYRATMGKLKLMARSLEPKYARRFKKLMKEKIEGKFSKGAKAMRDDTYKEIDSDLGREARSYFGESGEAKKYGDAVREAQRQLRDLMARQNPHQAARLRAADSAHRDLLRLEDAAARMGADEGLFTPAMVKAASRAMDPSKHKRQFSQGRAPMQAEAEAAQAVLPNKMPHSGTPAIQASNYLALGALPVGAMFPTSTALLASQLGLGRAAYSEPGQAIMQGLLAGNRPGPLINMGNAARDIAPLSGLLGAGYLNTQR